MAQSSSSNGASFAVQQTAEMMADFVPYEQWEDRLSRFNSHHAGKVRKQLFRLKFGQPLLDLPTSEPTAKPATKPTAKPTSKPSRRSATTIKGMEELPESHGPHGSGESDGPQAPDGAALSRLTQGISAEGGVAPATDQKDSIDILDILDPSAKGQEQNSPASENTQATNPATVSATNPASETTQATNPATVSATNPASETTQATIPATVMATVAATVAATVSQPASSRSGRIVCDPLPQHLVELAQQVRVAHTTLDITWKSLHNPQKPAVPTGFTPAQFIEVTLKYMLTPPKPIQKAAAYFTKTIATRKIPLLPEAPKSAAYGPANPQTTNNPAQTAQNAPSPTTAAPAPFGEGDVVEHRTTGQRFEVLSVCSNGNIEISNGNYPQGLAVRKGQLQHYVLLEKADLVNNLATTAPKLKLSHQQPEKSVSEAANISEAANAGFQAIIEALAQRSTSPFAVKGKSAGNKIPAHIVAAITETLKRAAIGDILRSNISQEEFLIEGLHNNGIAVVSQKTGYHREINPLGLMDFTLKPHPAIHIGHWLHSKVSGDVFEVKSVSHDEVVVEHADIPVQLVIEVGKLADYTVILKPQAIQQPEPPQRFYAGDEVGYQQEWYNFLDYEEGGMASIISGEREILVVKVSELELIRGANPQELVMDA
jgi:hypothetical protein